MDKNIIKQLVDTDGHIFAELKYSPEYLSKLSKHSHENLDLVIIDTGEIKIDFYPNTIKHLHQNKIAIFNPQQVHITKNCKEAILQYYSLLIDTQWCIELQKELFGDIDSFVPIDEYILADKDTYDNFKTICKLIIADKNQNIKKILKEFLISIFKVHCTPTQIQEIKTENILLEKVETFISANLDNQISIDDISEYVGYSSAHISRIFKKKFGLTPHAYIVDKKVHKAKDMILNSENVNLAEVANESGFYDQSHFVKTFKKAYSLSPNAYKK